MPLFVEHPDKVRYPVGDLGIDTEVTQSKRQRWLQQMAQMPKQLEAAVSGLDDRQLGTPYREGGWTLRQVVHHLADAHLNGFVRFKLALTEELPPIKTYEEALWAETADGRDGPVELSLQLLGALHQRWMILLRSVSGPQFGGCAFSHPQRGLMTIDKAIQLYAWHGVHHTAQITGFRARQGW
ncbi:MAG TPA: putative metal-dependent hydrolase [Vicinamibacteria bacterium]|nr:putative metal-dependent hydrolase [Vicinamibacteria bacterium]